MNLKKIESIIATYAVIALPLATTAFAMNATTTVKILSFASGLLAVIGRGLNPKDAAFGIVAVAKTEVDANLAKQEAAAKK
jgi:purine nucleoside permease